MTASRLLMRGFAGVAASVLPPAPNDATWTRYSGNPVLSGDSGQWNAQAVDGPSVIYLPRTTQPWNGWYAGTGSSGTFMGAMDSSDGNTWTWHLTAGVDVPVLGGSHGGITGTIYQPNVDYSDGTYFYAYYHDPNGTPADCLSVATSTDGYSWTVAAQNILAFPSGVSQWAGAAVLKLGSAWYMLVEGAYASIWETFAAKSTSSPTSGWTILNGGNPLSSLQIVSGGMFGGPLLVLTSDGLIRNYYHAAPGTGTLPTNLYAASISQADFEGGSDTWTQSATSPILTHSGSGAETSQLADPSLVWDGSQWRMYFAAVSSQSPYTAVLEMATTGPV